MGFMKKMFSAINIERMFKYSNLFKLCPFLQGVSIALLCKPCTSYDQDVCLTIRLSVRHTLALSENDAS